MSETAPETRVLEIAWGESAEFEGLRVTFNGGSTVNYGGGRPPQGSVILGFEFKGQDDQGVWMQSDWSEPHEVFGFTYRVLNEPELKPRSVRVEVRKT